jgi:hypothetical protein
MKVTIDIECTPEEARAFFGLPDVRPLQAAMMQQVQDRMTSALQAADPDVLMKTWLPVGMQSMEQMQKFWSQIGSGFNFDPTRTGKG